MVKAGRMGSRLNLGFRFRLGSGDNVPQQRERRRCRFKKERDEFHLGCPWLPKSDAPSALGYVVQKLRREIWTRDINLRITSIHSVTEAMG